MTHRSRFALHIFCSILFCLVSGLSISAQQCSARSDQLSDAPELRGFRLGATFDQVTARVPQVQFGRADEIGLTKTSINPLYDPRFDKAAFADIRTISFDFLDGKLTTLWIGYESSFKWQSVAEFVRGISKSLNVPGSWSPKRGGQQLRCDGFTVYVALIAGSPSIRLSDDAADETIAVRREEVTAAAEAQVIADKITKLYYPANCEAAENISPPDRIVLRNREEAEKAGYKLATNCQ